MLRVGLTGGIGAGKSTVAGRLVELGATLVDSDVVAREVVRPGSPGLAEVVAAFGERVLDADGALDRPALASIVFEDPDARRRLNGIVHPLVGRRTAELVAAAPADAVVVQDIPLLVENGLGPGFHLVVVVGAPVEERVRRLRANRGMSDRDARARIASQADDDARRAAADVWLDNSGSPDAAVEAVDRLWRERLVPFEENLRLDRPRGPMPVRLVAPDERWPEQYARLAARIERAVGEVTARVDHIGSTSVPGLPAKDVLDIQLGVASVDVADVADTLGPALRTAGFVEVPWLRSDNPTPSNPDPERWRKRLFTSADPGRPVNLHLRAVDSPGWRYALLFRDWLRADESVRTEYLELKRRLAAEHADDRASFDYGRAKERWFDSALPRADAWAQATGWRIPFDDNSAQLVPGDSPKV
ncbi:dephospho-CoA kinase [Pseudonocardia acaciae]|uniref:dephospho-CoA kinase n=1 Tax=Pseudonocardia acaciae TaxID=551276 RepID=UPI0006886A9B|nr:dephospho-CoA kinase [Pseudonocardia acaciae]